MNTVARLVMLIALMLSAGCGDGKPRDDTSLPLQERAKLLESALAPGTHYTDLMNRFKPDRYWLRIPDPSTPEKIVATGKVQYRASAMNDLLEENKGKIQGYGLQFEYGNAIRDDWSCFYEVDFDKDGNLTKWRKVGDD